MTKLFEKFVKENKLKQIINYLHGNKITMKEIEIIIKYNNYNLFKWIYKNYNLNNKIELAEIIMDVVGFKGEILFNTEMPDGTPRKLLDTSLINKMGWRSSIELEDGLYSTYDWLCSNLESIRS